MIEKNIKLLGLAFALTLTLCSCNHGENGQNKTDEMSKNQIQTYSFPTKYYSEGEKVHLDMVVEAPEQAYFIKGKAVPQEFDYEAMAKIMIPEEEVEEMDTARYTKKLSDNGSYEKMCYWGADSFFYQTYQEMNIYGSLKETEEDSGYNLDRYAEEKEFDFGTAEECLEIVMSDLKGMGIELDTPEVDTYYLDYETLMQEEQHYDIDGNKETEKYNQNWTEEDNYYLYYIHQTYSGMRDYHKNDYGPSIAQNSNAQVSVIYGERGIVYLAVNSLYDYEAESKYENLLEFDEIAEQLLNHYDNLLDDSTYQVSSARLCCDFQRDGRITAEREIRPVWAFNVVETPLEGDPLNYEIRVDAINGKIRE